MPKLQFVIYKKEKYYWCFLLNVFLFFIKIRIKTGRRKAIVFLVVVSPNGRRVN